MRTKTWRNRIPTEEDKKRIAEIWRWFDIALDNRKAAEPFQLAAFAEVGIRIKKYLDDIGFWTYEQ